MPPKPTISKASRNPYPSSYYNYKQTRGDGWKFIRFLFAAVILCLACSAGMIAGVMTSSLQTFNNISNKPISITDLPEIFIPLERKINILLMGQDVVYAAGRKRVVVEDQFGRSDTMMLIGIDPINRKINVLSIPRDSRVIIHGYNYYDKINAALAYGGPDLSISTVNDLTGVPIEYYAVVKIGGLISLIDVIGGLEMYVEDDMYWVDESAHLGINIHKGWHVMNGEQAHQYVRFRKDALGDIGRIQRQQQFLRALTNKLLSPGTLVQIPQLLAVAQQNIITNMPPTEMVKIANFAKNLKKEDIKMVMLPGQFGGTSGHWLVDHDLLHDVILDLFPESQLSTNSPYNLGESPTVPQQKYKLSVLNGTEHTQLAKTAAAELQQLGWKVWSVRKARSLYKKTQIIAQTGKTDVIPIISRDLGMDVESVPASIGDIYTDFTIILGEDYARFREEKAKQSPSPSPQN